MSSLLNDASSSNTLTEKCFMGYMQIIVNHRMQGLCFTQLKFYETNFWSSNLIYSTQALTNAHVSDLFNGKAECVCVCLNLPYL